MPRRYIGTHGTVTQLLRPDARAPLALLVLAGVLAVACRDSTHEERWPLISVTGIVRAPTGAAVADADVLLEIRRTDCEAPLYNRREVATNTRGEFDVSFPEPAGTFVGCLRLTVSKGGSQTTAEWPVVTLTPEEGLAVEMTLP